MAFKDYVDSLPNLREEKIKEIAEETCSHVNTVYRWMNGSITPPPLKQKVISLVTGVPVDELFPDNKKEIEQGVEIFKQAEKLLHEGLIEIGKDFDIKGTDKLFIKNITGKEEEVVFDSVTNVLYFRTSYISRCLYSYFGEENPQNTVEKRLSKIPGFIGFVRAHRFENSHSSCMAFNYDIIQKNYNVRLTFIFEDLKSITYDSDSKQACSDSKK